MNKAVVIGIGNTDRGDDAAGCLVARRMAALGMVGVEVHETAGDGTVLMELWREAENVVLVDALVSGAPPGTVRHWDASVESIPARYPRPRSSHALGPAEGIELARALGRLPDRIVLYGIEGERFGLGDAVSPPVADAVEVVAQQIRRKLAASPPDPDSNR